MLNFVEQHHAVMNVVWFTGVAATYLLARWKRRYAFGWAVFAFLSPVSGIIAVIAEGREEDPRSDLACIIPWLFVGVLLSLRRNSKEVPSSANPKYSES